MTSAVSKIFGGGGGSPAPAPTPEAAPAADEAPAAKDDPGSLSARAQLMGQRASGSGAMRGENEIDMLGMSRPRQRGAARAILG